MADSNIMDMLRDLGRAIGSSTKSAALDAPTSHASGKADDGDAPAKAGEFAAMNKADAKDTQGPAGVDSSTNANPQTADSLPQQKDLAPSTAVEGTPEENKPVKTVVTSGSDSDTAETLDKKAAALQANLQAWLTESSAVLPIAKAASEDEKKDEAGAEVTEKEDEDADKNKKSKKVEVEVEVEKAASATIQAVLSAYGVAADADVATKKACLITHFAKQADRHADGFLTSLDADVLRNAISGVKSADDTSAVLPPAADADPAAAAAVPMDAAPVAAPAEAPAAGGQSKEEMIAQILQAAQEGQITPEEMISLLQEIGVDPQVLAMIVSQMQGAGAAPAAAAAPAASPAPDVAAEAAKSASAHKAELIRATAAALVTLIK